jgi:hypothetical protein
MLAEGFVGFGYAAIPLALSKITGMYFSSPFLCRVLQGIFVAGICRCATTGGAPDAIDCFRVEGAFASAGSIRCSSGI